jgi:hypothetical protein
MVSILKLMSLFQGTGKSEIDADKAQFKEFTNCNFYWILRNQMLGGRSHQIVADSVNIE